MTEKTVKESFMESWGESEARIKQQLPDDVPYDKFRAVVFRAVQEEPDLMFVDDKRSLFLACQRAAQDGLIPDKREGALVVFRKKVNGNWISAVQWMPMIGGLRKRIASLGFDIRARVVHANDFFDHDEGDDEKIVHKPAPLNEERGDVIGAYAIATDLYTGNVYREVMRRSDIEKIKEVAKTDSVWNKWYGEKARVAVSKRLIKYLPLADRSEAEGKKGYAEAMERFQSIIDRDNELYDPSGVKGSSDTAARAQKTVRKEAEALPPPDPQAKPENYTGEMFFHEDDPGAEPIEAEPEPAKKAANKKKAAPPPAPEEELEPEFEGMEPDF